MGRNAIGDSDVGLGTPYIVLHPYVYKYEVLRR